MGVEILAMEQIVAISTKHILVYEAGRGKVGLLGLHDVSGDFT